MSAVLVINADLGPLHRVSLHKAIRMLCRQVAVIHEEVPGIRIGPFPMPKVLRLTTYIVTKWRFSRGPAWSKRGVLERDGRCCGYCGRAANTIDHIHPASRGGKNTWANTAACCYACNQRKGGRFPAEAGMRLLVTPATPTWAQMVRR
jgi:5-methylcytosine-specific restriction endonuclease McrA